MRKILCFLLIVSANCLIGCRNDDDFIEAETELVIEGWIDSNGFPVVILTNSVPIRKEYQRTDSLEQYVIKWAKVTVSDGEQEVVLTGKVDRSYFPGYIYTTGRLRGEAGKSYKLTVSCDNFYAEAETTIPHPCEVDSFCVLPCTGSDSLYYIKACFTDSPHEKNYYNFFTRVERERYNYLSSFLGNISDEESDGKSISVTIFRGRTVSHDKEYVRYFHLTDTVHVKFAQMDEVSYLFWNAYDEMLTLSRNQFFPYTHSMYSNIKGGLGCWCGYGTARYIIPIKQYVGR